MTRRQPNRNMVAHTKRIMRMNGTFELWMDSVVSSPSHWGFIIWCDLTVLMEVSISSDNGWDMNIFRALLHWISTLLWHLLLGFTSPPDYLKIGLGHVHTCYNVREIVFLDHHYCFLEMLANISNNFARIFSRNGDQQELQSCKANQDKDFKLITSQQYWDCFCSYGWKE